ncbi:Two-component sensor histidine kinase, contains HisKA and HATPase domains [Chitinophaga sp. YR627]|uniref:tetratricopeptide repeat-containing sensor histidine kinase n=1 Tax=Chitinophaga sp. YR627 TaxID=1881041 RepID=UPI0008E347C3|nr:histidine kinase dimerization/phosphoacceptor domain -containing protein [Chitinophaga sp. YR627]SFO25860.1 Two-component sensor histidine kinase, contains HisKA and HATPase domains [Chitinophaga sp. YR627]
MSIARSIICLFFPLLLCLNAGAQPRLKKEISIQERWALINSAAQDSNLVDLMIEQGQHYVWMPEKLRVQLDTALLLSSRAKELAQRIHYQNGYMEARLLGVKALLEGRQLTQVVDLIRISTDKVFVVHAQMLVGISYLERPYSNKADMDTAGIWFRQAFYESRKIGYIKGRRESTRLLGRHYFESHNIRAGKEMYLGIINELHTEHNYLDEADWWIDLGYRIPDHDSTFTEKAEYMTNALLIYIRLRDIPRQIWVWGARAEVYRRQGKLQLAEAGLLKVLEMERAQGDKYLPRNYIQLMDISLFRSNLNKALGYGLACVQAIDESGDSSMAGMTYEKIGSIYSQLNDPTRSIEWYRKALTVYERNFDKGPVSRINYFLTKELIKLGKTAEALAMLHRTMKYFPPVHSLNKELVAGAFAACYTEMGQYRKAEQYYHQMLYWESRTRLGNEISAITYYSVGKFYLERKQYQQAAIYLDTALSITPGRTPVTMVKDMHLMLFQADSILNRNASAIHHLRAYQLLSDSIYSATHVKELEEIQVKYETSQKEKDIAALRQQSRMQQKQIKQSNLLKRVTFGSIILLVLLLLLSVNRYRLKQRSIQALAIKQKEITDKNSSLQRLVEEKEWLVKEVHHRVKNNLQIVMSLLNTQSNFLESEAALAAIKDSAHRMQSISLIHQKLYQSEYLSLVSMPSYIHELVHYLEDSYRGVVRIFFDLHVAPVEMDVSQAVPMGLILSEVVTNAIKYAFPNGKAGSISISLDYIGDAKLLLVIADNGKGLPADVNFAEGKSLGIRLIQTFAAQLDGQLEIESKNGLTVRLTFHQQ